MLNTDTEDINKRFLDLYRPCHDRLGRFIASMHWNREEAKDIMSETLLVALEKFDKVKDPEVFLYFLFGIASRLVKKHKRKSWRQMLFGSEDWEIMEEKGSVEQNADQRDLYVLLENLNDASRETFVLFEISGFSIKEISEIQNSSISAVKSRLVRSRRTLEKICAGEKSAANFKIV